MLEGCSGGFQHVGNMEWDSCGILERWFEGGRGEGN